MLQIFLNSSIYCDIPQSQAIQSIPDEEMALTLENSYVFNVNLYYYPGSQSVLCVANVNIFFFF